VRAVVVVAALIATSGGGAARAEEGDGRTIEIEAAAVDASPLGALRAVLPTDAECAPFCVARRVAQRPVPSTLARGTRVEVWSAGGEERGGSLRLYVLVRDARGEVAMARTPIVTPRDDCGMGKCWDATVGESEVARRVLGRIEGHVFAAPPAASE
jgi:hypothetical protein